MMSLHMIHITEIYEDVINYRKFKFKIQNVYKSLNSKMSKKVKESISSHLKITEARIDDLVRRSQYTGSLLKLFDCTVARL